MTSIDVLLNLTDEERDRSAREIENFLEFTRDVLNDPTILEHIPTESSVTAIPIAERDPNVHYDIETPRYLVVVTPPDPVPAESAMQSNGHTDGDATRRKHDRAAKR